jgi:hypothetical protein
MPRWIGLINQDGESEIEAEPTTTRSIEGPRHHHGSAAGGADERKRGEHDGTGWA